MNTLPSLESVTDWTFVEIPGYSAPVPDMPKAERDAWVRLANADRLSSEHRKLFNALTRKMHYRADRDTES